MTASVSTSEITFSTTPERPGERRCAPMTLVVGAG